MTFAAAVREARAAGIPIPAFNVVDVASLLGVARAATKVGRPFIAQASARTVAFYGAPVLRSVVDRITDELGVRCFLHLDHCQDEELIEKVIGARFDGFMIDASERPYADNVAVTHRWAERGHERGLVVEGEVSPIRGAEEGAAAHIRAEPASVEVCLEYAAGTGVDLVGADIGTAHGFYAGQPTIRFDLLAALDGRLDAGFVVHGGSGLSAAVLARLARAPVAKINFSTDLKAAWTAGVSPEIEGKELAEPLAALREASGRVEAMAVEKFRACARSVG